MFSSVREHPWWHAVIVSVVALALVNWLLASSWSLWRGVAGNDLPLAADVTVRQDQGEHRLSVSGTGKVHAPPDIAVVSIGFTTQDSAAHTAQDRANKTMTAIIRAVREAGVAEKDVRTTQFTIYPQYVYTEGKAPMIRGYEAQQSAEIRIRNFDIISQVLAAASRAGATNIDNLRFTIDDPESLKAEARAKAIANAKTKAEAIAQDLGTELGDVVSFQESFGGPIPIYGRVAGLVEGIGGGADIVPPTIETGTEDIMVTVNVIYQMR